MIYGFYDTVKEDYTVLKGWIRPADSKEEMTEQRKQRVQVAAFFRCPSL